MAAPAKAPTKPGPGTEGVAELAARRAREASAGPAGAPPGPGATSAGGAAGAKENVRPGAPPGEAAPADGRRPINRTRPPHPLGPRRVPGYAHVPPPPPPPPYRRPRPVPRAGPVPPPRRRAGRGRDRRGGRERAGALTVHDAREAARPAVPKAPGAIVDAGSAGGAGDDGRANANAGKKAASRGPRKGPSIKWTKEEVSPSQLRALPFKRSIFNGLPQAVVLALHRLFDSRVRHAHSDFYRRIHCISRPVSDVTHPRNQI